MRTRPQILATALSLSMIFTALPAPVLASTDAPPAVLTQEASAVPELETLRGNVSDADGALAAAIADEAEAEAALDVARTVLDEKNRAIEAAQTDTDARQETLTAAEKAKAKADEDYAAAQAACDRNSADIANENQSISDAQAIIDGTAVTDAEQAVADAEAQVAAAQANVDAAQAAIDAETSDPGNNAGHREWTAYGFFQSIRDSSAAGSAAYWDAQCAMDILDGGVNTTGHSYASNQGPEPDGMKASQWPNIASHIAWAERGDAVGLDNFRTSIQFLEEFNSIRAEENAAEGTSLRTDIGTNCRQMAISIVQCDASKDYSVGHTQAYTGLEDLSWSSRRAVPFSRSRLTDPYVGWYDEEKVNYKENNGGVTGHYTTIVDLNSGYFCEIAGFAVCNYNATYGECRELSTFGDFFDYDMNPTPEVQYPIATFASMADNYYCAQVEAGMFGTTEAVKAQHRSDLSTAQAGLDSANAALEAANQQLAAARAALAQAESDLSAAQARLAELESQSEDLAAALRTAEEKAANAAADVAAAQADYDEAFAALEALKNDPAYAEAVSAAETAETAYGAAQTATESAREALEEAQAALDSFTNLGENENIDVIPASDEAFVYDGTAKEPEYAVIYRVSENEVISLTAETDYTVTYSGNTEAGTATARIAGTGAEGSGSWWGTREVTFAIAKAPSALALGGDTQTYTGKKLAYKGTADISGEMRAVRYTYFTDADCTTKAPPKDAGTYYVLGEIAATDNYEGAVSNVAEFVIEPAAISGAKLTVGNATYTGKTRKPAPVVKYGSATLVKGTDYTVSYKNNINAGKATVIVTGKGNYTGTKSAAFTIAKAKNPLVVKVTTATLKYATLKSKALTLAAKKVFTISKAQGKKTFKITSWTTAKAKKYFTIAKTTGKITAKKGTPKGTYKFKVKVTAAGDKNYKAGSKTVTVKIVVK